MIYYFSKVLTVMHITAVIENYGRFWRNQDYRYLHV